jgi:hypothetical protein
MTLSSMLRSDSPESTTRLSFFLIVLSLIGWEWYAVITRSTVPHIAEILLFAGTCMGWKQYNERKQSEAGNANQPPQVQGN